MRIVVISDLHISNRWIGNVPIVDQSIKLAYDLIEYCKIHEVSTLFIAGDIIDKAIDRPQVYHATKKVFNILSNYFDNIYYILGQHDCVSTMTDKLNVNESIVTLLSEYPNVHYMDGKIITLGGDNGITFGFANFCRDSSYKLDQKVEFYITHFTISNRFGQSIDDSNFDVMIAGDIHHPTDIGKLHAIGSFQQQSVTKDSEDTNLIIIDTKDHSWIRNILTPGCIKMRYSEELSGVHDGVFYIYKNKRSVNSNIPIVNKFGDESYSVVISKVAEYMAEHNLSELNNEITNQLTDVRGFSTDFQIFSVKVHNFLKIKDIEVSFNLGDKVLLTGENGSGKSTFLNALYSGLVGNITWNNYIGKFDSEVYVEINLIYNENNYKLRRGSGYQSLSVNDSEITYKNRNDFNGIVISHLPFIQDLGILFQRPEVGTLFEHISSNNKLTLISKIYHLEYLDQLYDTGIKLRDKYKSDLNNINKAKNEVLAKADVYLTEQSKLGEVVEPDTLEIFRLVNLKTDYKLYKDAYDRNRDLISKKDTLSNLLLTSKSNLDSINIDEYNKKVEELDKLVKARNEYDTYIKTKDELDKLTKSITYEIVKITERKCPRCNQTISDEFTKSELDRLRNEELMVTQKLINLETYFEKFKPYFSEFDKIKELKSEVDNLKSKINTYKINIYEYTKQLEVINKSLSELNVPEEVIFTEDDDKKLQSLINDRDRYEKFTEYQHKLDDLQTELNKFNTEISNLNSKLDELNSYTWYVCKSGPIYKLILESLCDEWSNDKVRFSVYEGNWRGNPYLDIKIEYLKGIDWQDYSASSSGEKSYMDVLFIKAVTANAGFLILDEFLRHMSTEITNRALDEINSMENKLFILSSFNENLYFANRYIRAKYIPENDECKLTVN